jgi:lipopolysaccharide assembly protein A
MRVMRTLAWVVITAALVAFIAMNWHNRAPVNFWPLAETYLHFLWPVGVIALAFFLLGFVPAWLLYKVTKWRLTRRIAALDASLRAAPAYPAPPVATSTQLEQEQAAPAHRRGEGGFDTGSLPG